MSAPTVRPLNHRFLQVRMANINSAGSVFVPVPCQGSLLEIRSVIDASFTVANVVITPKINGTAISGVTHTIVQSGSAAGQVNATQMSPQACADGDYIQLTTGAQGTGAVAAEFVLVFGT